MPLEKKVTREHEMCIKTLFMVTLPNCHNLKVNNMILLLINEDNIPTNRLVNCIECKIIFLLDNSTRFSSFPLYMLLLGIQWILHKRL